MKIYQICWWVFNGLMFNDNYKNGTNISDQVRIIIDMEYTVICYLNCLQSLNNIEIDLFDINFDEKYTGINQIKGKFKRDKATFGSLYGCNQLLTKFEQVYANAIVYNKQLQENKNDKTNMLDVDEIKELKDITSGNSNFFQEIEASENINFNLMTNSYQFSNLVQKNEVCQSLQSEETIELQLQFNANTTTTKICNCNCNCSTFLNKKSHLTDFIKLESLLNSNNIIIVNCNQSFQDVFKDLSTYLRYCQIVGVSLHAIIGYNFSTILNILLNYALYLCQIKSHKAGKYFKYCLKLVPLNEKIYFHYSLYLFQIEKNYKQSFYNLKVSKKLGYDLDQIVKQFKLLSKKFKWKKNKIGFICDYNQCNNENTLLLTSKKLICANCKCAWYCNKKCQKKDWIVKHKNECIGQYLSLLNSKEEHLVKQQIWLIQHISDT